jgi:hypothetical protein
MMRVEHGAVMVALIACIAGGCARGQAKTSAAGPPLDVPAPPPRVLAPVEEPATVEAPPPETPPAPAAAAPRTPPRPPARRTEPERPPESAAPAAATPPAPAPPEPSRELRPASPAADATAERDTREALSRASAALSRVDYGKLSADSRAQYDQSKRFMEQAQQALKDRNFVFAATLADKAATLAVGLQNR